MIPEVHVIGVGASGSHVMQNIAKTRTRVFEKIHVWDSDVVTADNCRGQTYCLQHVALQKVDAIAQQMQEWAGIEVTRHSAFGGGNPPLSGIVFLCATMSAHKMFVDTLDKASNVSLIIETRLAAENALIHVFDPHDPGHLEEWHHYWYPDTPAAMARGCGASTEEGPIAGTAANFAVWQMMRYAAILPGRPDRLDNQIRISMRPLKIETFQW